MWNSKQTAVVLAACLALQAGTHCVADDRLQLHGFFSQAAAHTDANNVGGSSDGDWALDMREMGANISYRPNADWLLSGQALARWAGSSDEGDLRVDYAFVDRTLVSDADRRIGVQVGKVKNPYGLYNTTRDVAHTRPGIVLPQAIYIDELRNTFLAAPGLSLNGNHYFEDSSLEWTVNLIRPEVDAKALTAFMVGQQPGHFVGQTSWLAQALWEQQGGHWRIGLTLGNVEMSYRAALSFPADLFPGHLALHTGVLSLEHNREDWSVTAEYMLTRQIRDGFIPSAPGNSFDMDSTVEGGYLQGLWRLAPRWQTYARYEALYLDRKDRNGKAFSMASGGLVPPWQRFGRDKVVGVRFDPNGSWALSAEFHDVDGTAWLPRLDNPAASMRQNWRMVLLQAAFRF